MTGLEPALIDAAAVAAIGLLAFIARYLHRASRGLRQMLDDWRGEPGRPGVPARPGVMERLGSFDTRLSAIEAEVSPNGGASMRDAVARVHLATTGRADPGNPNPGERSTNG